ncbi:MAG TPA: amidohydrolase family protein [Gammaproteobacteria bacterium]|jgi:imidazolonepropionase-like amidohydrolase|nr:hypothetical protein [Gammaproteobacteria bacterium]MBQ09216.1 hypothetical protein [Gammaproteobacteria bacterium]HJM08704.1 amidohydrolase family protein [Gammaproteobacteria bacterium]HJN00564.1 amidohydrolase family protein [Gammaproteobacteria bacterium]|tara:strand:- start:59395 stop:60642 length:1248 start_codon:yes stop_codon:yes gene_type:complete
MKLFRSIFLGVIGLLSFSVFAKTQDILIKNATVITSSEQGTLDETDVLIQGGIISLIGKDINSGGALIIEANGRILSAGILAPVTNLGLIEIELEAQTRDDRTDHYSAGFSISSAFNASSTLIPYNRTAGITSAIVFPSSGRGDVFSGLGSAFKTHGKIDTQPIATDIAMVMQMGGNRDSRASLFLELEDAFMKAKQFKKSRNIIQRGGFFDAGEYSERDLEALLNLIEKRKPLIAKTNRASDMLRMIEFSKKHEINIIFHGAKEAWRITDQLAEGNIPVIIDPMDNIPSSFDSIGARIDAASLLTKSGVTVLIGIADAHNSFLSRQGAGNAVANGMDQNEAMKALTINIAEAFGLDDSVGSIEVGKDADLVLWDGDPLEVTTFSDAVIINGKLMSDMTRSKRLRDRYLEVIGLK